MSNSQFQINIEDLLQIATKKELRATLETLVNQDCYVDPYLQDDVSEAFLELLFLYNLVFVASDDRILITSKGSSLLQFLNQSMW